MPSNVITVRRADEHSTSSGAMPASVTWRRIRRTASLPRPASGRSWSSSSALDQLDLAWRSRYRTREALTASATRRP